MTCEKSVQDKNMMFPIMLLKLIEWVVFKLFAISCYKAAMKVKNYYAFYLKSPSSKSSYLQVPSYPSVSKCDLQNRESQTIVCDMHGSLLRSNSFFPFFMLIAFEGGSIFRAFLLLLASPFLLFLHFELKLRVMTFITFCGLNKKYVEMVGRAVFPKFYLENLNRHAYEVLASSGVKMVFTSMPRVMVEGFLKEYLSVDDVIGTELQMVGNYFTGFMTNSGMLVKHKALKEIFGEKKPDVGIGSSCSHDHLFISQCKEAYVVDKEDIKSGSKSSSIILPREKYPKPLIFHDGRLAFLPTPLATLAMFMWLPLAIPLAVFRIAVGALPVKIALLLGCSSGIDVKVKFVNNQNSPKSSKIKNGSGVLYVCTHRTLLDPVMLSASLQRPLSAVTYSLSKVTEIIAPIKTVRLTRNRQTDGEKMAKFLSEGDLVVCPEGTTCREPYLLRFSSLFAELTDEIVPVAINTHVTMFYGTTASGMKCLDAIFFFMNPKPSYYIQILEKLPREMTCGGGKSSHEVANYIQRQLGDVLGFECTNLTRKDKYLMLAGNDGLVKGR
ncbi:scaffold/adaptor protein [Lithospermum erythrorhizon]|uniref:Scaffold/adaptor protein n=1 Tax=Lithospermum erythrorhizon TaxID=34254 RepID=A0AAV3Q5J8_LITER